MTDEFDRLKQSDPARRLTPPKPGSSRYDEIRETAMTTTHAVQEQLVDRSTGRSGAARQRAGGDGAGGDGAGGEWPGDELAQRRRRRKRVGAGLAAAAAAVAVLAGSLLVEPNRSTVFVEPVEVTANDGFTVDRVVVPLVAGGFAPAVGEDGSMVAVSRYNEPPLRTLIGQGVTFRTFRSDDGVSWRTVTRSDDAVSHVKLAGETVLGLRGFGDPYQGVAGIPTEVLRLSADDNWELADPLLTAVDEPGWFGRSEIAAVGSTVIVSRVDLGQESDPRAEHFIGDDSVPFEPLANVPAPLVQSAGEWFYASDPWGLPGASAFRSNDGVEWQEFESFGPFELAGASTSPGGVELLWQIRPGDSPDVEVIDNFDRADLYVSADGGFTWLPSSTVLVPSEGTTATTVDGRRGQQFYDLGPAGAAVVDGEELMVSRDGMAWASVDLAEALAAQQTGIGDIDEVFGNDDYVVHDLTVGTDTVLVHLRKRTDAVQLNETLHPALRVTLPPAQPTQAGQERFEFTMEPSDLVGDEVLKRVTALSGHEVVEAEHVAWVNGPTGRVDFYRYKGNSDSPGLPGPVSCSVAVSGAAQRNHGCSAGWEDRNDPIPSGVEIAGRGGNGVFEAAELIVSDQVETLTGTTGDGTTYQIDTLDGFGWVEWLGSRGTITLVARDGDGNVVGQVAALPLAGEEEGDG